jgi:PAS domain S-box-containing protein
MEVTGENLMENQSIRGVVVNFRDITDRTQSKQMLQESEAKFNETFRLNPHLISITSIEDGTLVDINDAYVDAIGWERDEIIGKTTLELQILKDPQDIQTIERKLQEDGEVQNIEIAAVDKYGDEHYGLFSAGIINIQGKPHVLAVVNDITERKQADEALRVSEEKFRAIFENANDEILYMDNNGTVIDVNRKIEGIFGYKPGDVIGKKFTECGFISPTHTPATEKGFNSMMGGNESAGVIELEVMDKDGNTVFIEASVSPLEKDGKIEGMLAIVRDITERKRSEEELRQYSVELQQANSELTEYAQVVAHDIGTPLRAIRYHTRILRKLNQETTIDDQRSYIDAIDDAVTECEELTQNLQGLSRIRRSELRIESINVGELLQRLISSSGLSEDANIVMAKKWPTIDSDIVLLSHIFRNLIDNAIKFNDAPDTRVEIKWSTSGRGKYEFSVYDNGIGIAPKDQEVIFQVFKRLHHQDKYKGTGIGLAIVKKAASLLGGSIRVESKLGKGSTFVVTIPKSQENRKK